ncbi:serine hydrolase [Tardiphaga sp. P9-11]|jgi:CubicO group peptidase (beta-lactamase class C family)|uniref:serine hydrolase domain-containing protein n=1 Tax=Tardiphaga sp. P9-11 TaxID=2024614 RepID=UPI0011F284C5|nr:serine hydrolase [Tardiphaga sp. P9-11]KAA0076549.1 class C beta-lactamase-related serine hydrolase [Tardiphaga sp. P9-11]
MTGPGQPSAFEADYGFERSDVRLGNWRQAPWNVWAFRHVSELIPTAHIAATPGLIEDPSVDARDLIKQAFPTDGETATIKDVLRKTSTDALVVMKSGRVVADYHAPNFTERSRHILFSASKSVTSIVAGILHGDGLIDLDATVAHYVPELKSSAYSDASLRDVLDMRVSLDFEETYQDPRGDFARYRRAGLLEPSVPGDTPDSLIAFLATLQKGPGDHGGPFHYCSPNSDVLGLVIERASGQRFADFAAARLWQPLGARQDAYITVDAIGSARTGGGFCMTPRDLARIGEMMRLGGTTNGRRIVSQDWVMDTITNGSAKAWRAGKFVEWLPDGRYRNKWYQTGDASGAFFALGIHGQYLYVNPRAELVVAKFSSQPEPVNNDLKRLNLALFDTLARLC